MFVKITSTYLFKQNDSRVIFVHSFASFHYDKTMVSHLASFLLL